MFKLLRRLAVLAVLGGGLVYYYGSRLPREHRAQSFAVLTVSPDTVFDVIRNIEATPTWWPTLRSATRVRDARRETWEQNIGAGGIIRLEVTRVDPGRLMVTTIVDADENGWGGTWTYEIVGSGGTTQITITEDGYVNNPIARAVMKWMGHHRTLDSYLRALGGVFGEPVTPRHG